MADQVQVPRLFASLALALIVFLSACSGGTGSDDAAPSDNAESSDISTETDRPCDGGAFPDDVPFRELLCALQWAQVDVLSAGGEIDTSWGARSSQAILLHGDDRPTAIADLEAVLVDMRAAAA